MEEEGEEEGEEEEEEEKEEEEEEEEEEREEEEVIQRRWNICCPCQRPGGDVELLQAGEVANLAGGSLRTTSRTAIGARHTFR